MDDAPLIYLSGSNLDGPQGTDRQLAEAVAQTRLVTWVDPPVAIHRIRQRQPFSSGASLRYVPTWGPPLITRSMVRPLSRALYQQQLRRALRGQGALKGQVLSSPLQHFYPRLGPRMLFLTDDWVAGAHLMGLNRRHVSRILEQNLARCNLLAAVTQHLLDHVSRTFGYSGPTLLLPNACDASRYRAPRPRPLTAPSGPYAILIGQINERLDLDILQSVVDNSVDLVIAGTYRGRTIEFERGFSRLVASRHTYNVGHLDLETLVGFVQHAHVGLTPYRLDDFNLASSPLKTWDYLAAGLPVVSTDLPASRAIKPAIDTTTNSASFVERVVGYQTADPAVGAAGRRDAARENSWSHASERLVQALETAA